MSPSKYQKIENGVDVSEKLCKFGGIEDLLEENKKYKEMLSYLKFSKTSNKEIHELIPFKYVNEHSWRWKN